MRSALALVALLGLIVHAPAGETNPKARGRKGEAPAEPLPAPKAAEPADYRELSRLIHQMVVKQVPREHEERFNWGNTVPIPEKLSLPRLRTYVKVGDHVELPHGAWSRVKVRLADPERDLRIRVRDFQQTDKAYRLVIDADATLDCAGEWQQWQKGLLLVGQQADAVANLAATVVCDVDVQLDFSKLPPALKVEPRIADMTVDLRSFDLLHFGGTVHGEKVRLLANDLMRDGLRDLIKVSEPKLKDYANDAIARSLKEGKGVLPADALLRAVPPAAKK